MATTPPATHLDHHRDRDRLAAMPPLRLGPLPAGTSRRSRFVATLAAGKGSLMGAGVRFDLRWRLRD